jgi:trypsin
MWHQYFLLLCIHFNNHIDAQPRIVGGKSVKNSKYPYFSSLYQSNVQASEYRCGGTLVAPDIVMSAAHCALNLNSIGFAVINNTNLDGDNPFGHVRKVVETVIHPQWNSTTLRNDILLLRLNKPVHEIEPITYNRYTPVFSELDSFMILGLGLLEYDGKFPKSLQGAEVNITTFETCNDAYSENLELKFLSGLMEATQFCASSKGRDACQGDSGGPILMVSDFATDIQLGIVSFGYECANKNYPGTSSVEITVDHVTKYRILPFMEHQLGVYTKLSGFSKWIDETICTMSQASPSFCSHQSSVISNVSSHGQNIRISKEGLAVMTTSSGVLKTISKGEKLVSWSLPVGVGGFDDLSIVDKFIFAIDVKLQVICSYSILENEKDISFASCFKNDDWKVGSYGGISCKYGVCVIVQGTEGMTIVVYNETTGAILSAPRVLNHLTKEAEAFFDVEMISVDLAALSTQFKVNSKDDQSSYGTMLIDLHTLEIVDDSFRLQEHSLPMTYAVEPSNFPLVTAFHHDQGKTFMYTAHGGMTVQDIQDENSTYRIQDTVLGGKFRALTLSIDSGIAVFGGLVNEDLRNYVMIFDLSLDPLRPQKVGYFQVPNRILSLAAYDFHLFLLGMETGVRTIKLLQYLPRSFKSIGRGKYNLAVLSSNVQNESFSSSEGVPLIESSKGFHTMIFGNFLVMSLATFLCIFY